MISYDPFYRILQRRNITEYYLIHYEGISSHILYRMKHGYNISTKTLNQLCSILHCDVEDILQFRED